MTSAEVSDALHETMMAIIDGAKGVLEKTPPELSADIIDRGIMLTGGGALLKGISQLFADELKVPVLLADDPFRCGGTGNRRVIRQY